MMQQYSQKMLLFVDKAPNEAMNNPAVTALPPHLTSEVQYLYQSTYLIKPVPVAARSKV